MKTWMQIPRDTQFSEADIVAGVCDAYVSKWYDDDAPPQETLVWPSEAFTIAMNTPFDCGYGAIEGRRFTLWTRESVFFPVCYDGAEWVASVPRDPNLEVTCHVGGG
jgi:hypothetical protein